MKIQAKFIGSSTFRVELTEIEEFG